MTDSHESGRGVVCLGASAGGLHSLEGVLSGIPPTFPWPILIAQHTAQNQPSLMVDILARATKLEVREARAGESLQGGRIYIAPMGSELGVSVDMRITLRPPATGRPQRVDFLFSSAAVAFRDLTVAVVLSGTGDDGAAGALAVQLNGGTVLAEAESSAASVGMPRASTLAGAVDLAREPAAIGALLVELAAGKLHEANTHTDAGIRAILDVVATVEGPDIRHYRRSTLRRRVLTRMALAGYDTFDAYCAALRSDAQERLALTRSLLVPVTEFFRDPESWNALMQEALPGLRARLAAGAHVDVWCAGCATGEEAYTIAMLLLDATPPETHARIMVYATDLDAHALERAREGVYPSARTAAIPPALRERYFEAGGAAREELRARITFRLEDITRVEPPTSFDLVVCRNVLIYFEAPLQARVLNSLARALRPGGHLLLGASESIVGAHPDLEPVSQRQKVFRKEGGSVLAARPIPEGSIVTPSEELRTEYLRFVGAALARSTAVVIITDVEGHVLWANRHARERLGSPLNPESLLAGMGTNSVEAFRATVDRVLDARRGARLRRFDLGTELGRCALVVIEPLPVPMRAVMILTQLDRDPLSHGMLAEDSADLASSNEELQTANEELATTNEELQSTNEELASLNEEFQSTNEALGMANDELQSRAVATGASIGLLQRIVSSSPDAVMALDDRQLLVVCNKAAAALFSLDPIPLGRDVRFIPLGVKTEQLQEWLRASEAAPERPVVAKVRRPVGETKPLQLTIVRVDTEPRGGWILTWREVALPASSP